MKNKLAILGAMSVIGSMSGIAQILPPQYIPTNGAAERRSRGPQTQADFDALAKAEAKRERKAAIRRSRSV
ncbi:MAG: hypothetical protein ACXU8A_00175 [Burkholderiaceae bacterium]